MFLPLNDGWTDTREQFKLKNTSMFLAFYETKRKGESKTRSNLGSTEEAPNKSQQQAEG
jgi:hypothetical protein